MLSISSLVVETKEMDQMVCRVVQVAMVDLHHQQDLKELVVQVVLMVMMVVMVYLETDSQKQIIPTIQTMVVYKDSLVVV